MVFKILIALAAVWLALAVLGWLFELAVGVVIVGLVLFVVTSAIGWAKRSRKSEF